MHFGPEDAAGVSSQHSNTQSPAPGVAAEELSQRLRVAAVVMQNLPELPWSNGSILQIDDQEAATIAKAIEDAVTALAAAPLNAEPLGSEDSSRESQMVTLKRDATGRPSVWCDPEIADLVKALNDGGLPTVASCSGHGKPGVISLSDGRELIVAKDFAEARRLQASAAAVPETPSSNWHAAGEEDPHGNHYNGERAALCMGDLTDDELANGVFLYDHRRGLSSIGWLTAAKERIRWLSRSLEKALAAPPLPAQVQEAEVTDAEVRAACIAYEQSNLAIAFDVDMRRALKQFLASRTPAPGMAGGVGAALRQIADMHPKEESSIHGPRMRCQHCGYAWVVGKAKEQHAANCAYCIAHNALSAAPRPSPAPQAAGAELIERIAQEWDECFYDAAGIGEIDIGAAIRKSAAIEAGRDAS